MCIRQKTTVIVLHIRQKDKNMNREYLRSTISDRKENYLNNPLVVRSYSLENEVNHCFFWHKKNRKIIHDVPKIKNLCESGIPLEQILYINFEDERLLGMSAEDLNHISKVSQRMII